MRFQIELIFRDAKQCAGFTHCQSTDKTTLENRFNLALGAISVAKTAHWLPVNKEVRGSFSMAELKTYYSQRKSAPSALLSRASPWAQGLICVDYTLIR
ncbi:MAG: hypothetical protein KF734_08685 [Saprospiraceae bacterium]|nr:hypothetical protein [Saprospiraceae bacterium]